MLKRLSSLNNQRGAAPFLFHQIILIIIIVLMATVAVITIITHYMVPQQVTQAKENSFEVDRVNLYNHLSRALQSAQMVSISNDKTPLADETGRITKVTDNTTLSITRAYKSEEGSFVEFNTFDDVTGVVTMNTTIMKETVGASGQSELVHHTSSSLYYDTLTKLYAKKIDKVCTNDTLNTGCYSVENLLDIILYSNNPLDTEQAEMRSRRLMHYD